MIAYTTEVVQVFSDFTSEISGQKCICNAWIVISRVILSVSYHVLTLMGFSFCYLHVTEKYILRQHYRLMLSNRQFMINKLATLCPNPFHSKNNRRNKKTHPLIKL